MSGEIEWHSEDARMITFDEAAARGDFIQLERRPPVNNLPVVSEDDAPGISPAKALLATVAEYLDEYHPHWRVSPGAVPEGLRLEMHPRVHYTLAQDSDTYSWPREPGDSFEELYRRTFRLPVKITPDLPGGTWRLVVVTEDVKLGGKLPAA